MKGVENFDGAEPRGDGPEAYREVGGYEIATHHFYVAVDVDVR